jgi:hypothetical protein
MRVTQPPEFPSLDWRLPARWTRGRKREAGRRIRTLVGNGAPYFVGFHSRASRCASVIWSGLI